MSARAFSCNARASLRTWRRRAAAAKPEAPVRGNMRITAPVVFGSTRLGPLVVDFLQQHPELSLSVELSDRSVDLIEEGYDLAIRTGRPPARVSSPGRSCRSIMCCARRPLISPVTAMPTTPTELGAHHCITGTDNRRELAVRWPGRTTEVPIYGRLQVNNAMLRCDAARAGAGVLLCADYLVEHDFANGRLVRLLPDYAPTGSTLHAVSPAFRAGSPKVRSLVNHLTTQLGRRRADAIGPTPARLLVRDRAELSAGEARRRTGRRGGRGGARTARWPCGGRGRGVPDRRAAPARRAARRFEEADGRATACGVPGAARIRAAPRSPSAPPRWRRSSG